MIAAISKQDDKNKKAEARAVKLFGRDTELGLISNALLRLKSGRNDCLLFGGQEGMGKSELLAHCQAEAHKLGFLVYSGHADESADSNPYQPVFSALGLAFGAGGAIVRSNTVGGATREFGLEAGKHIADVINIFNSLIPNPIGIAFEVSDMVRRVNNFNKEQRRAREEGSSAVAVNKNFLVIHQMLRSWYEQGKKKPIVLIIDDAQYARETTFKLLDALITPTFPILVMLGWDGSPDEVPTALRTLISRTRGEMVKLDPLAHHDTLAAIDELAHDPRNHVVEAEIKQAREQIASFSAGVPGIVHESIEYLAHGGEVAVFTASDESADDTTRGATLVGALTAKYLDTLSPDLYGLLECAAVVGRRFPIELLTSESMREYQGLSASRRGVLRQLAELAERHQIITTEASDEQALTFTSAHIHNSLLRKLPPSLLRADHLEVATAWEQLAKQQGSGDVVAADLARHFFAAAQYEPASRYYMTAAAKLFNETAYAETADSYTHALACLDHLPASDENLAIRREVLTTRSLAYEYLGNTKDAIADLEAALPLTDVDAAEAHAAESPRADLLGHLGWLYFKLGNYGKAASCFDQCEQLYGAAGDLDGRVRVGVYRGSMLSQQRNFEAAITELQGCLSLYAAHGISEETVAAGLDTAQLVAAEDLDRVYLELGLVYNRMRKLAEAERYLRTALDISERQGDRASAVQGKHYLGQCLSFQCKAEAIQYLSEAEQEARTQLKDRYLAASIGNTLAYAYQNLGRASESAETFQKLIPELEGLGDSYGLGAAYGGLGGLYARMWKLDEALDYLQRDLDLVNADEQPAASLVSKLTNQIADLQRLKGDHEAAWVSVAASRAAASRLSDQAAARHSEGFAALTAARLHADAGAVDKAQSALDEAKDKLADIPDTRAAIIIIGGQLARLQQKWATANQMLTDNLKTLWPGGDAYEIAITGLELTRLARDMDEPATANRWANWTIERAKQLDNVALAQLVKQEVAKERANATQN